MKRCPQCNRVETDDSLVFCRTDGTSLVSDSLPFLSEAGTTRFGTAPTEIGTSILPHATDANVGRSTGPTSVLPAAKCETPESAEVNLSKMNKKLPAGSTLLHYRIVSKIDAGGMGEVWLVEDTRLGRKVALKLLPAELTADCLCVTYAFSASRRFAGRTGKACRGID